MQMQTQHTSLRFKPPVKVKYTARQQIAQTACCLLISIKKTANSLRGFLEATVTRHGSAEATDSEIETVQFGGLQTAFPSVEINPGYNTSM